MKRIDATIDGRTYTFRTNDSGDYLFIDRNGSNSQINCECGYQSLRRIKKAISRYLHSETRMMDMPAVGRISYKIHSFDTWRE